MSAKNKDMYGRFRGNIIAFRASDEEASRINHMVSLSGLNKQDYLIQAATNEKVVVNCNPYLLKNLRDYLKVFIDKFDQIESLDELSIENLEVLERMLEITFGLKENKKAQYIDQKTGASGK